MPVSDSFTSEVLGGRCLTDGEFQLAARCWRGGLRWESGADGAVSAVEPGPDAAGVISLSATEAVWIELLAAKPPRFSNDIVNLIGAGRMTRQGDGLLFAQYYPAVMRAVELLRPIDPRASAT